MRSHDDKSDLKKRYEPPVIIEVHVDPQKELLQATNCGLGQNDPRPTCVQNSFT